MWVARKPSRQILIGGTVCSFALLENAMHICTLKAQRSPSMAS